MDAGTSSILLSYGISPQTVPDGEVRLVDRELLTFKDKQARAWAANSVNRPAMAYAIGSEHKYPCGVALRNLHKDKNKSHLTVVEGEGPFFHNFNTALPAIYGKTVVLCEGPKDARVLWSHGIPAVAYLGQYPRRPQLKVVRRYSSAILWLPDQDPDTEGNKQRSRRLTSTCQDMSITLVEMSYPAKDPGELARNDVWLSKIKSRVEEMNLFLGSRK